MRGTCSLSLALGVPPGGGRIRAIDICVSSPVLVVVLPLLYTALSLFLSFFLTFSPFLPRPFPNPTLTSTAANKLALRNDLRDDLRHIQEEMKKCGTAAAAVAARRRRRLVHLRSARASVHWTTVAASAPAPCFALANNVPLHVLVFFVNAFIISLFFFPREPGRVYVWLRR